MIKQLIKTYYKLLDEKLENWTIVVLLIAVLIVSIPFLIKNTNANMLAKSNVLENNIHIQNTNNILVINWIQYKIILEEIKK
jgi:multidrug efflux pump subunit AcrB